MKSKGGQSRKLCLLAQLLSGTVQGLGLQLAGSAQAQHLEPDKSPAKPRDPPAGAADAEQLLSEGRRLLKARQYEPAAAKLQAATVRAAAEGLPAEQQSFTYYLLGLAQRGAQKDEQAIAAFRKALALGPSHPEFRLDLAQVLLRSGKYQDARREAEHGLLLGLTDGGDQSDASALLKAAKIEARRERFSAYLALSFGYDSNVLVGTSGPCSDAACTGSGAVPASSANQQQIQQARTNPTSATAITNLYQVPVSRKEWDLPATLQLELGVRAFGASKVNLWYEYRFYQYLLTSVAYNHDSYNFQEHSVPVYLLWKPVSWLLLHPQVEGYFNFTGLKLFLPYQGGFRGLFEVAFSESPRWTTRVFYLNQFRHSFDRTSAAYLDGDRHDIKVQQELRLTGPTVRLRGQLSYRLRDELSGTFDTRAVNVDNPVPFIIPAGLQGGTNTALVQLGGVDYSDPMGYLGHEAATRWRLYVPAGVVLATGVSYEYRQYTAPSYAPVFNYPAAKTPLKPFNLPFQRRHDSQVGFDFSVHKSLRQDFGIELTYSLVSNFSNMANWLENRTYSKHTAVTTFSYTF